MPDEPWSADGLRFSCTRCANCCRGGSGYVWVTEADVENAMKVTGLTRRGFAARYLRRVDGILAYKDKPNGDCIFYSMNEEDGGVKGCTIYEGRPVQCRLFPWWQETVETPASWAKETKRCPGLNNGKLHARATIEAALIEDESTTAEIEGRDPRPLSELQASKPVAKSTKTSQKDRS
jgi:Fe-S-cluster containining protein